MTYSLNQLFDLAISQKASDVHILAGSPPIFRIEGKLIIQNNIEAVVAENTMALCYSLLNETQKKVFDTKRELDFSYILNNNVRARINIHWEKGAAGLVARLIPGQIPKFEELMMGETFKQLLQSRQGLVLFSGPSGCGKTTSLASMIDYINTERSEHIVSLEDPIEFVHAPKKSIIRQRELNSDMISFADALKHVVRQDPNVILVGEVRDPETIFAAITLAETGHLVMTSMHTIDAEQTIGRVIDFFPPHQQNQIRMQMSFFLKAVIVKLLVPRASGGRIPVYEIMINNPAISNLIRENKLQQIRNVMQTSRQSGMVTMDQEIERLRKAGEITLETAQGYFNNFNANRRS